MTAINMHNPLGVAYNATITGNFPLLPWMEIELRR